MKVNLKSFGRTVKDGEVYLKAAKGFKMRSESHEFDS